MDRRFFLAGMSAIGAAPPFRLNARDALVNDVDALARSFSRPPDSARPWVIWFWINGNVTREGITADLEAMQRVGLGGVQMMDVDPGVPPGPAHFGSQAWLDLFDFALEEAARLGLALEMNDDDGWTGSAGPWIRPDLSMQKVVWSETSVQGGALLDLPLAQPETLLGWYRDIVVLAFPTPGNNDVRLADIAFKAGYKAEDRTHFIDAGMPPLPSDPSPVPVDACIASSAIIDISAHVDAGHLQWQAPPGQWTIMRFGHTTTARDNHPVSPGGQGLECDKLSKTAIKAHMDGFINKLAKRHSRFIGKTFLSTHIDSWEIGDQNWTALFPAEFQARRGYSVLPWLPALSGRIIGDAVQTERFLWDVRQTIGDLVVENYAAEARRLAHEVGLKLSIEGYDSDPTNQILYGAQADIPQAEFWYGPEFFPETHRSYNWTTAMASAAHVYGRQVVTAEAFTAMPDERWLAHPATMKPLGDWALCAGVNHFIFHRFAMQPWLDRAPGMTMGAWGTHYERTQTWWELTGPWHAYLTRCQHLLRQGTAVADLLCLTPEGAPVRFLPEGVDVRSLEPPLAPDYAFDGCPPDALFTRVTIVDNQIVLPDGKRYHALVLPDASGGMQGSDMMTPRLLARIAALVQAGMTIIGHPPRHSPSLEQYPACDAQVSRLVVSLWGTTNPLGPIDRSVGHGRVMCGISASDALARLGIGRDFDSGPARPFRFAHRRLTDGSDLYFIANGLDRTVSATCTLRATGRPERWHPETGEMTYPALYTTAGGQTHLPVTLNAHEAIFIVFPAQRRGPPSQIVNLVSDDSMTSPGAFQSIASGTAMMIERGGNVQWADQHGRSYVTALTAPPASIAPNGRWTMTVGKGTVGTGTVGTGGAHAHAPELLTQLMSWTEHPDPSIKYFSGTATYRNELIVPKDCLADDLLPILDLGRVEHLARVWINGHDAGIAWKPPFVVPIAGLLRAGTNSLLVEVTNLWPNRLIGDEHCPDDAEWETADFGGFPGFGEKLKRWPEWLKEGKKSPTGRTAFATWKLWFAKDRLLPSGLLGPVSVHFRRKVMLLEAATRTQGNIEAAHD